MVVVCVCFGEWYLVCVLCVFDLLVVDFVGFGLVFGVVEDDYWLVWLFDFVIGFCLLLDVVDVVEYLVEGVCYECVYRVWVVVFDEVWVVFVVDE